MQTPRGAAYAVTGPADAPPVVLVHGLTLDRATWAPVVAALGDASRTITVDLPGHGESRGVAPGLDAARDAVTDTCDATCREPPVLVGHSLGAVVAALAAAARPARALVLVDQQIRAGNFVRFVQAAGPSERAFGDLVRAFPAALRLDRLAAAERALVSAHCDPREELFLAYWGELLERDPDVLDAEILAALRSARAPVLSIHASAPSPEYRAWLGSAAPDLALEVWPEGGHFPHLARPDAFAAKLIALSSRSRPSPAAPC